MKRPVLSLIAVGSLLTGIAAAQASSPLTLTLAQALVQTVTLAGKSTERLTPDPKNVRPGDVLNQVVTARNTGTKALGGVVVRLPVPRGTTYLKPAPLNAAVVKTEFSADGGKTYASAPLKRRVSVTENGETVTREVVVKPSEYTNVRWTLAQLPKGESVQVGFRVQVN